MDVENQNIQSPGCGHFRVQLTHGPGSGVAGIGKERLAPQFPFLVEALKGFPGHIDLAPDDEGFRSTLQHHRDGANGAQIFGDILPHHAVSPGGAPDKDAVLILQSYGQAVHLGLQQILDFSALGDPLMELHQLLGGKDVLQGLEGDPVHHLGEAVQGLPPHPLGGGIGGNPLRVGLLQLLQLTQHAVVFKIGDGGLVQDIVQIVVVVELPAELLNLLQGIHIR